MSTIYKSKTSMIKGNQVQEPEELLIPIKFFSKEEKEQENQHYQYEKLKHNLKKKITERIIDRLAQVVQENEYKKDIHVFASLNTKSDSNGLYQRLKKINKRINEPHKVKDCFINWLYKTPNLLEKRKRNKISKNDRNTKINNNFYYYQNKQIPNIATKTTDMTTKKRKIANSQKTKTITHSPKYKYNYSSNNSNVSYNKYEYGGTDPNKGNIYIGKRNGDASYFLQKNHNNFGSLTIIQHNIDNTKKYNNNYIYNRTSEYWKNLNDITRTTNRSQEIRNETTEGSKTLRNSNSSSLIFLNCYGGPRAQKSDDTRENKEELKNEIPIERRAKKIWTVRKETYECKEIF